MHNLLVLATRRRRLAIRAADTALLIAAALPGLAVGALAVSHAPKPPMRLAVGLAILLAVLFRLHQPGRLATLTTHRAGVPTGLLAGALTTTVGINGPPLVIWLRARQATLTELRDTLAVIFLALNLAAIPSLATRGGKIPIALLPALAAGVIAGHTLGLGAHNRLPARVLDQGVVAILATAAGASILAGATALLYLRAPPFDMRTPGYDVPRSRGNSSSEERIPAVTCPAPTNSNAVVRVVAAAIARWVASVERARSCAWT